MCETFLLLSQDDELDHRCDFFALVITHTPPPYLIVCTWKNSLVDFSPLHGNSVELYERCEM